MREATKGTAKNIVRSGRTNLFGISAAAAIKPEHWPTGVDPPFHHEPALILQQLPPNGTRGNPDGPSLPQTTDVRG